MSSCRASYSVLAGSFFSQSRIKCNEALLIGYFWLGGCGHGMLKQFTGHSSKTITDYISFYRQLVTSSLDSDDTLVGGENIIVEIDESKFGKRKHNRGHRVDGVWVVGGVERTEERRVFAETVSDRSAETLLDVIRRHVRPGSIIITDLWRGYSAIESNLGLEHRTVNHSVEFVAEDGSHTNTIEGTWCGIKFRVSPRNRNNNDMENCLLEFIWRRKNHDDLWNGLVEAFKNTSYNQ